MVFICFWFECRRLSLVIIEFCYLNVVSLFEGERKNIELVYNWFKELFKFDEIYWIFKEYNWLSYNSVYSFKFDLIIIIFLMVLGISF